MYTDPIVYIVTMGAVVISFLWLRDARIFVRTQLPGYRKSAYYGVLYSALGWLSAAMSGLSNNTFLYLSCGLLLLAMYLQSNINKEDIWTGHESICQRLFGKCKIIDRTKKK
ncbi:MAG TPA: ABC transporter permease [Methanocorpusculum sp.]|nr:ABC transporter permease [Methanocorpusculum sp.]HJJ56191.1 ABC transporter permease [Methanocorpusculum sp.]